MDAAALVPGAQIGVVAAPGAAGVGEDEDALLVVHKGGGLGDIGARRTAFDAKPVATLAGAAHDPAAAPGHLGNHLGAEAVQYLVEGAVHRRQGRQMLDHPVAAFLSLARDDRIAVRVIGRAGMEVAFLVGVELEQLGRERVLQIIEHVFPRRDVDREIGPFLCRNFGKAAVEQRLVGRDDLHDCGVARGEIALEGGDQGRAFHRR